MRLGRTLEANMIILLQLRPRRLPGVEKGQDTAAGSQLHHSYSRCSWNATRSYTMTMTDSPQTWPDCSPFPRILEYEVTI